MQVSQPAEPDCYVWPEGATGRQQCWHAHTREFTGSNPAVAVIRVAAADVGGAYCHVNVVIACGGMVSAKYLPSDSTANEIGAVEWL